MLESDVEVVATWAGVVRVMALHRPVQVLLDGTGNMGKRLSVGLVSFAVAILVASVVYDSWVAALPLLVAPLSSGWHARSFGELLLLSLTAGAVYLLFLLINGQLLAEPDPVDGSYVLVALYAPVIAFLSLVVVSGGYVAKRAWERTV